MLIYVMIVVAADVLLERPPSRPTVPSDTVKWTVEERPTVDIGDGSAEYEFFGRLVDAVVLNGQIHALDMSGPRVVVYSRDGQFVNRYGGSGEGPGEFVRPTSIWADEAGRIRIFDQGLQRLTTFSDRGELLQTTPIRGVVNRAGAVGAFADGPEFVREADAMGSGRTIGLRRDTVLFATIDSTGAWDRLVARVPGQYVSVMELEGRTAFRPAPFTPRPSHTAWGTCLFITSGDEPRVDIFDPVGRRIGGFATDDEPRRVEPEHVEEWSAAVLGEAQGEQRSAAEAMISRIPRADHLPVYNDMLTDPDGLIWLQVYEPPLGQAATLKIFDQAGRPRGTVVLPESLLVFQVGRDFVLGRSTDDLGVQRLRVYRFDRRVPVDGEALASQC